MFGGVKTLVVVVFISYFVFRFAKPIALRFTREEDFIRRRTVWFALTIIEFLSPSFWLYVLIAIPLLIWCAKHDEHPASLYFLYYFVVPPVSLYIPVVGVNALFELSHLRLMAIFVLIPIAWKAMQSKTRGESQTFTAMDGFVLAYALLQIALFLPFESPTNTLRRALVLFLDTIIVYVVFSRLPLNRKSLVDAMASFCLACAIFAPLGAFESLRSWLLYENVGERWGAPNTFAFLMRGDSLRAQVSTGHALALGSMMAIAFGFWLYLQSRRPSKMVNLVVSGWMWMGLLAAYSRAPWMTAVLMLFLFLLFSPKGVSKFVRSLFIASICAGVVLMTPFGEKIVDNLPFVGTVDQGNVTYRQELARVSWILIQNNPFFGDQFVTLNMESLRQGQGVIDLVNAYATVALFNGLVGLSLFCGVFLIGIFRTWAALRRCRTKDPDLSLIGASLLACMLGMMFYIATAGLSSLLYPLVGLLASYANLVATTPLRTRHAAGRGDRQEFARPASARARAE